MPLQWAHRLVWPPPQAQSQFSTTGFVYGTATYATAGRRMYFLQLPLEAEGRTVVHKSTYEGTERFRTFTYAYGIRTETRPRQFSD